MALSVAGVVISRYVGKSDFYRQLVRRPVTGTELQEAETS
jgi:hypothetical protein